MVNVGFCARIANFVSFAPFSSANDRDSNGFFSCRSENDLFEDISHEKENKRCCLSKRCDINWHLIPPIVTMCTCIIGFVACFFYFGAPYFSILFAIGTLTSLYGIYMAHEFENLETFSQNNLRLEKNVQRLEGQLDVLDSQLQKAQETVLQLEVVKDELTEQNKSLKESILDFQKKLQKMDSELKKFESENRVLSQNNKELVLIKNELDLTKEKLSTQVNELESKISRFIELYDTEAQQLDVIKQTLHQVREEGATQNLHSANTRKLFDEALSNLETQHSELGSSIRSMNEGFRLNIQQNSQKIQGIVEEIKKVFDQNDQKVDKLAHISEVVERDVKKAEELSRKLGGLESSIQRMQKTREEQEIRLAQMQEQYQQTYQAFQSLLTNQTRTNFEFADRVKQTVQKQVLLEKTIDDVKEATAKLKKKSEK